MLRQSLLTAALALTLIGVQGCATTPPAPSPFKIGQEEFYGKIKTIALAPVDVPRNVEDAAPIQAKFESLIEAKLREAGFAVVPSREAFEIFERMNKQLGGLFDPVTGKRDETKFKAFHEHVLRELEAKFKADAVLYARVVVVAARFAGGQANWHGVSESISLNPGLLGALQTGQSSGTTQALSLYIQIENIHGVYAYANAGGIQLIAKLSAGQFVPLSRSQLFADEARSIEATNVAVGPLVRSTSSPDTAKR